MNLFTQKSILDRWRSMWHNLPLDEPWFPAVIHDLQILMLYRPVPLPA